MFCHLLYGSQCTWLYTVPLTTLFSLSRPFTSWIAWIVFVTKMLLPNVVGAACVQPAASPRRAYRSSLQLLGRPRGRPRLDFWLRGYASRDGVIHLTEAAPSFSSSKRLSGVSVSGNHRHTSPPTDLPHQPAFPLALCEINSYTMVATKFI